MKARILTILIMLIPLGYSGLVTAHPCDRDPDYENHKHCFTDPDPNPDPGPDPGYTAALTAGGFTFGPVDVTPNNRQNGYSSSLSLDMDRPADGLDALIWDEVFMACAEVMGGHQIPGIFVGADWGISQGGKRNSDTARNIRITFRTVVADNFPEAELWFALFTWADYPRADFLPASGYKSVYLLDTAKIYGGDMSNHTSCDSGEFPLSGVVQLEICHRNEDGTGCN